MKDKYRNTYEVSESSIRIDGLGPEWGGAMIHLFANDGDTASLQFSGIRKIHQFCVEYLDEDGKITNKKLIELKKEWRVYENTHSGTHSV